MVAFAHYSNQEPFSHLITYLSNDRSTCALEAKELAHLLPVCPHARWTSATSTSPTGSLCLIRSYSSTVAPLPFPAAPTATASSSSPSSSRYLSPTLLVSPSAGAGLVCSLRPNHGGAFQSRGTYPAVRVEVAGHLMRPSPPNPRNHGGLTNGGADPSGSK